jgi:hypothetical protein
MPIGAFKINGIAKRFAVTVVADVIRTKNSVRAIGTAKIATAQSVFGGSSGTIDSQGSAVIAGPSRPLNIGTGAYTIEGWFRWTINTRKQVLIDTRFPSNNWGLLSILSNGTIEYFDSGTRTTTATLSINTWYHIAIVRSGTTIKCYINGVEDSGFTSTTNTLNVTSDGPFHIGNTKDFASFTNEWLSGFFDEVRVSNTARYTANFTTPGTRFTNDDNTLLLIHADGTPGSTFFEDDNGVRQSVVPWANGTVSISTAQSRFGGSSGLLNIISGSNNALQFGSFPGRFETSDRFKWGNYTNYTIESWVYFTSWSNSTTATGEGSAAFCGFGIETGFQSWGFGFNNTGKITLTYSTSGGFGNITLQESGTSGTLNAWHHIAFVKNGTSLKLYVNGTERASGTLSGTVTYGSNNWFKIGQNSAVFVCHFDEFRASNSARYTSNFTAPTQPFVNDADTIALLHCNGSNTPFNDDNGTIRIKRLAIPNGTANVSVAQSRFGGSSIIFDGSTAHINVVPASDFNFGTGNFTIEAWIYLTNVNTVRTIWGNGPIGFYVQTNRSLNMFNTATGQLSGNSLTIPLNTWTHVALTRNSGTIRGFANGFQQFSTTTSINITGITNVFFGGQVSSERFLGHMDEMRISNSARYTSNFTAPTAAFTNDANTLLLVHGDLPNPEQLAFRDDNGAAIANSSGRTAKAIQVNGNTKISTVEKAVGSSSALFDGDSDYLFLTGDYRLTGNFTIEFWAYWNNNSGIKNLLMIGNESSGRLGIFSNGSTIGIDTFGGNNPTFSVSGQIATGTWYHIALVRNGSTITLYRNGVSIGTGTSSATLGNANGVYIGTESSLIYEFNGYIDEVRVSSIARYTANFTTTTTPFVDDINTVFLLHFEGANNSTVFVDDTGGGRSQKGIQTFGDARISTAQSKFGGASAIFDGNEDWLQIDTNPDFALGLSDFTAEAWIRIAADSTANNSGTRFASIMSNSPAGTSSDVWAFELTGNTTTTGTGLSLVAFVGTSYGDISRTFAFNKNQWYHVAVVRSAGTVTFYVDGTSIGSGSFTRSMGSPNPMRIGGQASTGFRHQLNGFIDELRVSNSARYTSAFTPDTQPFANDVNTVLLIHADGTDNSIVFVDDNGINRYTPA